VARDTATRIAAEAVGRVRRATGETARGIHAEPTRDGRGYVVMAYDEQADQGPVDIYLEAGTRYMRSRPFFFASALLEEGPHRRRLEARVQEVLNDLGR
jgi:hypothetical protein